MQLNIDLMIELTSNTTHSGSSRWLLYCKISQGFYFDTWLKIQKTKQTNKKKNPQGNNLNTGLPFSVATVTYQHMFVTFVFTNLFWTAQREKFFCRRNFCRNNFWFIQEILLGLWTKTISKSKLCSEFLHNPTNKNKEKVSTLPPRLWLRMTLIC